jgi:GDP-L-fucose synthase
MMNADSRIYIAGHSGLVGSAITRLLHAKGYANTLCVPHARLDLLNQADVTEFFEREKPEYVFLAAAKVGGIYANATYRGEFMYQNIMITTNVIEAARRSGVRKLVNLGSSCIYPRRAAQPMTEDMLLTGRLEHTNEPYAIAKIAGVKMCQYYNEQYGTDYLSLMPTNLYGPNDNYNLETSHALPALIRKFTLAALLAKRDFASIQRDLAQRDVGFGVLKSQRFTDNQTVALLAERGITADAVVLWGSGLVRREFLHADDVAAAALHFMNNVSAGYAGELVNIGTGMDLTLRDVAQRIADMVGFAGSLAYDRSKPDGVPSKCLSVSRAAKLGWKAAIPFEEGLRACVHEYMRSCTEG